MALNASGAISLGGATAGESINLELGFSATATISLNDAAVRSLASVASGAIALNNFYSKSSVAYGVGKVYMGATSATNSYIGANGVDSSGNFYLASADPTAANSYLIKMSNGGSVLWKKLLPQLDTASGTLTGQVVDRVVTDANQSVFMVLRAARTTSTSANVHIVKLDSSGNIVWQKRMLPGIGGDRFQSYYTVYVADFDNTNNRFIFVAVFSAQPYRVIVDGPTGVILSVMTVGSSNGSGYYNPVGCAIPHNSFDYFWWINANGYNSQDLNLMQYGSTINNPGAGFQRRFTSMHYAGGSITARNSTVSITAKREPNYPLKLLGVNGSTLSGGISFDVAIFQSDPNVYESSVYGLNTGGIVRQARDSSGNIYLFNPPSTQTNYGYQYNGYIFKFNSVGTIQWQRYWTLALTSNLNTIITSATAETISVGTAGIILTFNRDIGGFVKLPLDGSKTGNWSIGDNVSFKYSVSSVWIQAGSGPGNDAENTLNVNWGGGFSNATSNSSLSFSGASTSNVSFTVI